MKRRLAEAIVVGGFAMFIALVFFGLVVHVASVLAYASLAAGVIVGLFVFLTRKDVFIQTSTCDGNYCGSCRCRD